LQTWVQNGGTLVVNVNQVTAADQSLLGVQLTSSNRTATGSKWLADGTVFGEPAFQYQQITPVSAAVLATANGSDALVTSNIVGQGRAILTTPGYLQTSAQDQLLAIGTRLFDWLQDQYAVARVSGPPIQYSISQPAGKIVVALTNNSGSMWSGTVAANVPGTVTAVKEYLSDATAAYSTSGPAVTIPGQVPAYDIRVYAIEYTASIPASRPAVSSFSASPSSITAGKSAVLSWSVAGATSVSIDNGVGAVTGSMIAVSPGATTTYTLTAANAAGATSATTAVTVYPAPAVSGIAASSITSSSAMISWKTNVASNGQVNYGLSAAYGSSSAIVDANPMSTSHSVPLSGQTAATTYHYQVVSVDASGNRVASADSTFVTGAAPATPPPQSPAISASSSSVTPGAQVTVSISGGPGNRGDWVGLYRAGNVAPGQYLSWQYMNGTQTQPSIGMTAATLTFTMPATADSYQFVLQGGSGFNPLATSNTVTVKTSSSGPGTVAPANGLIGYWAFNDGSGLVAADGSGKGNNAALMNNPTWSAGRAGGALQFNGSIQSAKIPAASLFNLSAPFSVAFWVYANGTGGYQQAFGRDDFGARLLLAGGSILAQFGNNLWSAANAVPANGWHHVAYVADTTGQKIYVDGVVSGSDAFGSATFANANAILVGNSVSSAYPLNGSVDEVRIYNRAVSASEVSAMVN
jgi:hypothetical protein